MKVTYSVTIEVPTLQSGIDFYCSVFNFRERSRPVEGYAILKSGDTEIGIMEKKEGTVPAKGSADLRRYDRHWTPVHIDFYVDDFDAALRKIIDMGGKCEDMFHASDKHPAIAFCSDPFGNGFCILQRK